MDGLVGLLDEVGGGVGGLREGEWRGNSLGVYALGHFTF